MQCHIQLYIDTCVIYIITFTNEVRPLLPGEILMIKCSNHMERFRPVVLKVGSRDPQGSLRGSVTLIVMGVFEIKINKK